MCPCCQQWIRPVELGKSLPMVRWRSSLLGFRCQDFLHGSSAGKVWSSKQLCLSQAKQATSRLISSTFTRSSACCLLSLVVTLRSLRSPALACALGCALATGKASALQSKWVPCIAGSCSCIQEPNLCHLFREWISCSDGRNQCIIMCAIPDEE